MTRFAFTDGPNRVIHEPARLKIISVLSVVDCADFVFLLGETGLTRGNLSVQLTKLKDAGYIEIAKEFVGNSPRTIASLTDLGRQMFRDYRIYLKKLLKATS